MISVTLLTEKSSCVSIDTLIENLNLMRNTLSIGLTTSFVILLGHYKQRYIDEFLITQDDCILLLNRPLERLDWNQSRVISTLVIILLLIK